MSERGNEESIWKPLWSDVSAKIDRELPGEPLWSQAIPIENGDVAEGVAIRREGPTEGEPEGADEARTPAGYLLVYFRLVPVSVAPSGEMITHPSGCTRSGVPGGAEGGADDWDVEVGYQEPFDTLGDAKREAGEILAGLPTPEHMEGRGYDFFLRLLRNPSEHE